MYKIATLYKRRHGMSVEDFQAYWLHRHAPIASKAPGLRRYIQSHTLAQGYAKGERVYDGVSEMGFDSRDAWQAALDDTSWLQHLRADEAEFIDPAQRVDLPVESLVIKDGPIPSDAVKNIEFVTRRPGMPLEAFRTYWRDVHGPLAAQIGPLRRYEQDRLRIEEYERDTPPLFDGMAVTWFDSTADMKAGARTEIYEHTRADEANFLPDGHLPFIVTREYRIIG